MDRRFWWSFNVTFEPVCRLILPGGAMTSFWRDLRHALRFLRLSPGFTLVAVLTLALGIGANTAIFQLIDSIRLRTIPVKNPRELGTIRIADRHWGSGQFSSQYSQLTFPMWEQIRKRQEGFAEIAVWSDQRFNLATGGEVRKAKGIRVSGDFFHVLVVEPILGRLLGPQDDQPGCGASTANISYSFWQRNFAADPAVVGKPLTLDGNSFQVIGVTQPGFNGISIGDTYDVAVPICVEPILSPRNNRLTLRHAWWLATIGRLKPGWTIARANAQMLAVTPAILQETIPPVYDAEGTKKYLEYKLGAFSASTGFSELRKDSETSLWLLLGITGLVLLIACANLANLMLARTSARERQITIRRALGATRWRMVRELLSESLLLAGVTADNKFQDMHEEFLPFMYFPATQQEKPSPDDQILIRSSLPLTSLIASMKETIADVNPGIDLEFLVFNTRIQNSLLQDQLMATLSGFFGFLAALLAAIGLYGVMAYMVVQRTREIGIRMAIGAKRADVVKMILREAGILTFAGLVIGSGLALGAAQAAKSLLYGLQPRDPLTLVLAVVTLSVVASLASFLPAYRASKLDPLEALRYE